MELKILTHSREQDNACILVFSCLRYESGLQTEQINLRHEIYRWFSSAQRAPQKKSVRTVLEDGVTTMPLDI